MRRMNADHDVCPASHAGMLDHPIRRVLQSPKRILGPYLHHGETVLDIGCGPGYFSCAMARMVEPSGCVVAADLQDEMLAMLRERAEKEGLDTLIRLHKTRSETLDLGSLGSFDFILAFYVVHEVPDASRFFEEVAAVLRPGGRILVVEPTFHVSQEEFMETTNRARAAGLESEKGPYVLFSRTALLKKTLKEEAT
jgi:ubiquinone/menaquinone biosynthesis C-methylase UbiE